MVLIVRLFESARYLTHRESSVIIVHIHLNDVKWKYTIILGNPKMAELPRFAARLRELREQAGLSQKDLADKAGLSQAAVAHLEQGRNEPTWSSVLALADALGVPVEAFRQLSSPTSRRGRGRPRQGD